MIQRYKIVSIFTILLIILTVSQLPAAGDVISKNGKPIKLKLILTNSNYLVVPGDRFLIEFSDRYEELFIDSNYNITSSAFDKINVKGYSLEMVHSTITEKLKKHLGRNIVFKFEMIDYGVFNILVKGELKESLFITGCGIDRLDYYLKQAGLNPYSSIRNIIVKKNGNQNVYDLFQFYRYGDISQNPIIFPGYSILIAKKEREVTITGAVKRPGKYELLKGEKIDDAMKFCGGLTEEAYPEMTRISHVKLGEQEYVSEYINLLSNTKFQLRHLDTIHVYDKKLVQPVVFIEGAINSLEIQSDKADEDNDEKAEYLTVKIFSGDRILDVLQKTGGFTGDADLQNVYVIRYGKGQQAIKVDLYSLLYKNDIKKNITVQNLDKIVIPKRELTVGVLGMVDKPQLFNYEPNKSALYYIQKAGGVIPVNGNNLSFWLLVKEENRLRRVAMSKADTIIMNEGNRIIIKPSGLYWANSLFPTINSFLGLTTISSNLVVDIANLYK